MDTFENITATSTRKPRLFRWALWWGLGVMVICLAILIAYSYINPSAIEESNNPITDYFYSLIYHYGIWAMMIFSGIVAPIIEEISFRLWGDGKLWSSIISIILMALWTIGIGWWLPLLASLCGTIILMLFRDDKAKRLFALMILSTVLFAWAHANNYGGNMFITIVGVVHKLGFGLVASYLVINHNILWSMGLHILNNSILSIPMALAFGQVSNTVVTLENGNFSLEVRPVLVRNDSIRQEKSFFFDTDTNYYFGNTSNFAGQAWIYEAWQNGINPNGDSINVVTDNALPNCSFTLVYKTKPFDHHGLIVIMEKTGLIKIDTTYSDADKITTLNIKSTYDPLSQDDD